ncbi:MAG: mechanosensitive ion channel [Bacteroidetes bacterium]|nr:mechanosensitive ion channel [Bacteroidota bacterium]
MKRVLVNKNIRVEGRRATWLRLLSQSIYLLTIYLCIYSFSYNNNEVGFVDFLSYNLFETKFLTLSFFHIIGIVVVFFSARIIVNFITLYITRAVNNRTQLDEGSLFIYIQVAKYIVYVISFIICLQILEVNLTIFLTGGAALLVGIGLGLQDVFRDVFSGIVLLFEGNLRVGDIVEIYNSGDTQPTVAKIIRINIRTTQIETRNGNVLIIPNNKLTQEYVENWSHGTSMSRFFIDISVEYGADTELVKKLLKQAALSHPSVNKTEPTIVRLKDFGENGLCLELIFWAEQSWEISNVKSEIRFEIYRLFREYKIRIPYPKMDIAQR